MPNRCGVVGCRGNYDAETKCRLFRLPQLPDQASQQHWIDAIPPRENFVINPKTFWICVNHWPTNCRMKKFPGGYTRPLDPPSIFNVPSSCLPTPKAPPRAPKDQNKNLNLFLEKDKIKDFVSFKPDSRLEKESKAKSENLIISRSEDKFVCIFMSDNFSECHGSIIVTNKPTLCSPLVVEAYKNGIRITTLTPILHPNNGLSTYSQFFEVVNRFRNFVPQIDAILSKFTSSLNETLPLCNIPEDKLKKVQFLLRQLELLQHKTFTTADYCFALEFFPRCNYEHLREFIVLPSKRSMQASVSLTDLENVLTALFRNTKLPLQKNLFLIVDEVKIRPTVAFAGGVLSGMAVNDPSSKATAMLCVLLKCLHGGPSLMISVTPVKNSGAQFQFDNVVNMATIVEKCGGIVLGSITDNHKINQAYCELFSRPSAIYEAVHPLDETRPWFLLFDPVHILKCIRNNWITEKLRKLTFDGVTIGSFDDVREVYNSERDNILKTTPLTFASVYPSQLQLQNVQHVLKVFNEKVVAALHLIKKHDTANFIDKILTWWKIQNVYAKGQDTRMRDPSRAVQTPESENLLPFLDLFTNAQSGHGAKRIQMLTHDTKKALLQTTAGQIKVCKYLFELGFEYVLLRELQSDRIEGEFSVYRQSTGANAFMTAGDVLSSYKQRLSKFAASHLQSLAFAADTPTHECRGVEYPDAVSIEECLHGTLNDTEELSCAYVAGWLEMKCKDLLLPKDEDLITGQALNFISEISRESLTIPHIVTFEFVKSGLLYMKRAKTDACCRKKLITVLETICGFSGFGLSSSKEFVRRLSNVLLHGLHNLAKDNQKNESLYQTSIKKARMAD